MLLSQIKAELKGLKVKGITGKTKPELMAMLEEAKKKIEPAAPVRQIKLKKKPAAPAPEPPKMEPAAPVRQIKLKKKPEAAPAAPAAPVRQIKLKKKTPDREGAKKQIKEALKDLIKAAEENDTKKFLSIAESYFDGDEYNDKGMELIADVAKKNALTNDEAVEMINKMLEDISNIHMEQQKKEKPAPEAPKRTYWDDIRDIKSSAKHFASTFKTKSESIKWFNENVVKPMNFIGGEYLDYGAASEIVDELYDEYEEIVDKALEKRVKPTVKKITKAFEFGYSGVQDSIGIISFVAPIERKIGDNFNFLSKVGREQVAKKVLFKLFPGATRIDGLIMSSFVTPAQQDGGLEVTQNGKTLKGKLLYENRDFDDDDRELDKATTEVLKGMNFKQRF